MDELLMTQPYDLAAWVAQIGDNPLYAMGWVIARGGWIILLWVILWGIREVWLEARRDKAAHKKSYVVLAVDVPKATEQTVKAVENMFAHFAGAHSSISFLEKWWEGNTQDTISCELISIGGHIQYVIRTVRRFRDLIEASIYAQYPDAEISEVEDYATAVPTMYPNDTTDCFGVEMIPVKSDTYPLKTYIDFEHQMTGEFKDPLAVMLEALGRLGPGEQAWYQIVLTPIDQKEYIAKATKEIKKITGQKENVKKTMVDKALDLPLNALTMTADVLMGSGESAVKKKDENMLNSRMWNLTPGERKVVEAIEKKMSKIVFKVKIRFLYIGKKEVFNKGKIAASFVGAIKQFNTNDAQSLKPEMKRVGNSGSIIFFKNRRNNIRKQRLISAYKRRSNWAGMPQFHLSTEELASLWHLPVSLFVKAPQVKKTESKKSEPPINLPLG